MEQPQRFLSGRTADRSATNFLASFDLAETLKKVQNRSFIYFLIFLLRLPTKTLFVVIFLMAWSHHKGITSLSQNNDSLCIAEGALIQPSLCGWSSSQLPIYWAVVPLTEKLYSHTIWIELDLSKGTLGNVSFYSLHSQFGLPQQTTSSVGWKEAKRTHLLKERYCSNYSLRGSAWA